VPVLELHPLIRDTSRLPGGNPARTQLLALAAGLLEHAATSPEAGLPEDPAMRAAWQSLTPHASEVFQAVAGDPRSPDSALTAVARAAHFTSRFQASWGFHAAAEAVFRDVLAARLRVQGADHPHTLATRYQLAREMAERGDHTGAEAEYRDVLAARLRVQGADHADTLATRHQIAVEMSRQGDHAGAEAEYRDVLAAKLRVLGADHPDTLTTRHGIAREMSARGDHTGAQAEFRDVLAAKLRVLGPDHPSTLSTKSFL
jgi:plasmid stability protein